MIRGLRHILVGVVLLLIPAAAPADPGPERASPETAEGAPPTAEATAYGAARDAARMDWERFRPTLDRWDQDLRRFQQQWRSMDSLSSGLPDSVRRAEAAHRFGWPDSTAAAELRRLEAVLGELETTGFAERFDQLLDLVGEARKATASAVTFEEFSRFYASASSETAEGLLTRLPRVWRQAAESLSAVAPRLPASPLLARWVSGFDEGGGEFPGSLTLLKMARTAHPPDSLCAEGDAWRGARRAFLNEAVRVEGAEDCRDFLLSHAYPRLRGVAWESATYGFFFDPESQSGYLLARPAAERAYLWRGLLDPPPDLDPFRLAWLADRFRPEPRLRAAERRDEIRAWADPDHPSHPLFGLLGLDSSLQEFASLADDVFLARHAAQAFFAERVDSLFATHRDYGFVTGVVSDAIGGAPLSGARIIFSRGDWSDTVATDSEGVYGLPFTGEAGTSYRVSLSREGYQTLLVAGVLAGRHLAGQDFVLNPEPRPFLITGKILGGGSSAKGPVSGAVVTARSARGTASKFVTGADGRYRLTLLIPRDGSVEVIARKGEAAAGATLTALGERRTGVDLRLRALSAEGIARMVEIPPPSPDETLAAEAPPAPRGDQGASGDDESLPEGALAESTVPEPAIPEAALPPVRTSYAFVPDGTPFTQATERGDCTAASLSLEVDALTFPLAIHPGGTYTVEVGVRYDSGRAEADTARVLVKAFFFDATPQGRELLFTDSRRYRVAFTFDTDEVDLGHPEGRVGVGAGGVFACDRGDPAERVVTALQSYRRQEGVIPPEEGAVR